MDTERYEQLSRKYAEEYYTLKAEKEEIKERLSECENASQRAKKFIRLAESYSNFEELTPTIINEFISKIVVHERDVKRAKSNSSDASERGNAYHKLLQKMHYENIGKFSDIKDFVREEISLLKNKKYRELIDIDDIVKFLNTNLGGEFVKQHQNLKRENQFIMGLSAKEAGMGSSDETILIQGVIDAYIENENGIILVDYKTDNVNNEDVLINRYRSQLMLYKKSLEMSTGKTVQTVYIYSFALGKEISLK